jgi:hypothetical protein
MIASRINFGRKQIASHVPTPNFPQFETSLLGNI